MTAYERAAAALTRFSGMRDSGGFGCAIALRRAVAAAIRDAEAAARADMRERAAGVLLGEAERLERKSNDTWTAGDSYGAVAYQEMANIFAGLAAAIRALE